MLEKGLMIIEVIPDERREGAYGGKKVTQIISER